MNKPADNPRKALGKGLSALLPSRPAQTPAPAPAPTPQAPPPPPAPTESVIRVGIDDIDPNPLQPRSVFQNDRLHELAISIESNGIIQPLVVRKAGNRYQLIAGERRLRAAKLAGLDKVPVVLQEFRKTGFSKSPSSRISSAKTSTPSKWPMPSSDSQKTPT